MSFESDSNIAIEVIQLSKCYEIYDSPRDRLKQFFFPIVQKLFGSQPKKYFREFWALNDINLTIRKGETVGIIGRNGSGKSTLLQTICSTLFPTAGTVSTHGRVAALLELGSGFNPEFTGRENVFMNAAVLGLTKSEIESRFEQIMAFADIGDFIEQPVKTYSSGMMVRLAFAVIAHVDADVLVVDEALAVGDAVFTQKCMRFIRQFKEKGTLLFVSHDMSSVLNLCERAVWLHQGRVRQQGLAKEVSQAYLQYTLQEVYGQEARLKSVNSNDSEPELDDRSEDVSVVDYESVTRVTDNLSQSSGWTTGAGRITSISVELANARGSGEIVLKGGELIRVSVKAEIHQNMVNPILGFLVRDRLGQDLFGENTLSFSAFNPVMVSAGDELTAEFMFRLPMLPNGDYPVMGSLADGNQQDHIQHHWLHDALILHVSSSKVRFGLVGVEFKSVQLTKQ